MTKEQEMLRDLRNTIDVALELTLKPMSLDEQIDFYRNHKDAHVVVGDFEIKCLHPEKYDL